MTAAAIRSLQAEPEAAQGRENDLRYSYQAATERAAASESTIEMLRKENGMQHTMLVAAESRLATVFEETRDRCISICAELNEQSEVGDYFDMAIASMRTLESAAPQDKPTSEGNGRRKLPSPASAAALTPGLERAAEICHDERLTDNTGDPTDIAYLNGIRDCVAAIRAEIERSRVK